MKAEDFDRINELAKKLKDVCDESWSIKVPADFKGRFGRIMGQVDVERCNLIGLLLAIRLKERKEEGKQ